MKTYIKPFTKLSKNDTATAGGKGASLGEMTQADIPVPPGFVVLTDAFERFLDETDLRQEVMAELSKVDEGAVHTAERASEQIQILIKHATMPDDIASEVVAAFAELGAEFVAVRSSATSEDGSDNAWAGQLDSFLNTTKTTLIENVQKCWASLFTPRAIVYRIEKGLKESHISVAVVVQKMIQSESSGIAFSVHPVTEDRNQLIIEAGFGLGEAIVSGAITPDSYVVEKDPRKIIDTNVSEQTRGIFRASTGSAQANEWRDLPPESGGKQVLNVAEILELSELVVKIEQHYGFPVDIEWAQDKEGKFYIVQSRPITTLAQIRDTPPRIPTFRATDHVFTFESNGTSFIFEDIVVNHYMGWESLTLWTKGTTRVYVPKTEIERLHAKGNTLSVRDITQHAEDVKRYASLAPSMIAIIQKTQPLTREVTQQSIDILAQLCTAYSVFDIHFSDGIYRHANSKQDERLRVYESEKNVLRDALNLPFFNSDGLLPTLLDRLAKQFDIQKNEIQWYREHELTALFDGKKVPDDALASRRQAYVFAIDAEGKRTLYTGKDAQTICDQFSHGEHDATLLKGTVAHGAGKITRGHVRIIKRDYGDPSVAEVSVAHMNQGEILVSQSTDPTLMDAFKKAVAVVTDVGGMLSHAAITARELNLPCIVGTEVASKILRDGDLVEVDANEGVVRILEKVKK